jgi:AcrR family transcriptional regulator
MPKVSEEHRAARREQIINAMLRCVARDGFHKTTMAAVVAESGLSAGMAYIYFKNKDDLIRAIAETVAGEGLSVVLESESAEVQPPHQVLAAVLERVIALGEERGVELHRVALQAWAEAARAPEVEAIYRREGDRSRAAWTTYVERAIAAGHLPSDADPVRTAHTLIGLIPGFMVQRLVFENLTPASYAAGLADLMGLSVADS